MELNLFKDHLKRLGFLFLIISFCSVGCHKEEELVTPVTPVESLGVKGNLAVKFTAHFGSELFEGAKAYAYQGKQKVMFSKVEFYLTDIQLLGTTTVKSDQAALIDLTGSTEKSKSVSLVDLPSGHYTGISFTLGVVPALNKKTPSDFQSPNPLALTGNYWDGWVSYIFTQVLGLMDPDGNGNFSSGFAILTGTDDCNQKVTIEKEITIKEGAPASLTLDVDILQYFKQGSTYYDLLSDPLGHDISDVPALKKFTEAMAKAIVLKN
jgi:hypothetical protein